MKKVIICALLTVASIGAIAQAPSQKKSSIPIPPPEKQVFTLSDATASRLPAGAIYKDGKVTAASGYSFIKNANGGADLINNTSTQKGISGTFTCSCGLLGGVGGASCGVQTGNIGIYCKGSSCCSITVEIPPKAVISATSTQVQTTNH